MKEKPSFPSPSKTQQDIMELLRITSEEELKRAQKLSRKQWFYIAASMTVMQTGNPLAIIALANDLRQSVEDEGMSDIDAVLDFGKCLSQVVKKKRDANYRKQMRKDLRRTGKILRREVRSLRPLPPLGKLSA